MEVNEDGMIQWIRKSWKPHFWMAIDQGIRYTAFLGQSTLCSGMFYLDLQDIVSSGSLVRISHSVLSIDTKFNGKLTSSTGRFWTQASCNVWKPMSSSVGSQHDASWASSGKAFWWDMRYEGHIVKTWNVHQSDRAKPLLCLGGVQIIHLFVSFMWVINVSHFSQLTKQLLLCGCKDQPARGPRPDDLHVRDAQSSTALLWGVARMARMAS